MAEVGDRIVWPQSASDEVYRVGHYHELAREIDGLTEEEWLEQRYNSNEYLGFLDELDAKVRTGHMTEDERNVEIAQANELIRREAALLFGSPNDELDEYARNFNRV